MRHISFRSGFFLLVTGSVLFWLLAGFLIFSLINNLARYQDTSLTIQSISRDVLQLQNTIQHFYVNDLPSEEFQLSGKSIAMDQFNEVTIHINSLLGDLRQDLLIGNNQPFLQKMDRLMEYLTTLDNYFETMVNKSRQRGWDRYGMS